MSKFSTTSLALLGNKGKAEAITASNERLAATSFRSQISGLETLKVDREIAVEQAAEAFSLAVTPVAEINDRKAYIANIVSAKNNLRRAQEAYNEVISDLDFFNALYAEYFATEAVAG